MSNSKKYPINLILALEFDNLREPIKDECIMGALYSVATLPKHERYVIEAFFKDCKTMEEIASDMKSNIKRVAEIGNNALNRLRRTDRSKYIMGIHCIVSDLAKASVDLKYAEYERRKIERIDAIINDRRLVLKELNDKIEKIDSNLDKISNVFGISAVDIENILVDTDCNRTVKKTTECSANRASNNKFPENLVSAILCVDKVDKLDGEQLKGLEFLLSQLNKYERDILVRRYKNRETLQRIGKSLGLSRERVRQIENTVIEKLRSKNKIAYIINGYSVASGNEEIAANRNYELEDEQNRQQIGELNEFVNKLKKHKDVIVNLCGSNYNHIMSEIYRMEELVTRSPYNIKIKKLHNDGKISVRTYNCLCMYFCKHGYSENTIGLVDISKLTRENLLGIRNFGVASLKELESILHEYGLKLTEYDE